MVGSPCSFPSNYINVLSEENWGVMDVSNFPQDGIPVQYPPTSVVSTDIHQHDPVSQSQFMPPCSNQLSVAAFRSIDWSHTIQQELSGASAEFHYTSDPSGTIPLGAQSTLGPIDTSFPNTWIPQASYFIDASSEFIQANDTRGHLQLPGPSRR